MATQWKFKVEIHEQDDFESRIFPTEFWAVIVAKNGRTTFTGETRKRKLALIKTVNNLFPGVVIVDKTQSKK